MHTFIEAALRTEGTWHSPNIPEANDRTWQEAFASTDESALKNVSRAWFWVANRELEHVKEDDILPWLEQRHVLFGKAYRHADTSMYEHYELNGTVKSLLELYNIAPSKISQIQPLVESLDALWHADKESAPKVLQRMAQLIDASIANEVNSATFCFALMHRAAWDVASEYELLGNEDVLGACLSISCNTAGYTCHARHRDQDPLDGAWQTVKTGRNHSNPKLLPDRDETKKQVLTTPLSLRLPLLAKLLLSSCIKRDARDATEKVRVQPNSIFNDTQNMITSLYPVLAEWFPELKNVWVSSEVLGVYSTDALRAELVNHSANRHSVILPEVAVGDSALTDHV